MTNRRGLPPHALRASLVAPLAAPLLYFAGHLLMAFVDPVRRPYAGQNLFGGLAIIIAVGAPMAYAAVLLLALPALWLLSGVGRLTLGRVVLVGSIVGIAVAVPLAPALRGDLFSVPLPLWAAASIGAASAALWWSCAGVVRGQ